MSKKKINEQIVEAIKNEKWQFFMKTYHSLNY